MASVGVVRDKVQFRLLSRDPFILLTTQSNGLQVVGLCIASLSLCPYPLAPLLPVFFPSMFVTFLLVALSVKLSKSWSCLHKFSLRHCLAVHFSPSQFEN